MAKKKGGPEANLVGENKPTKVANANKMCSHKAANSNSHNPPVFDCRSICPQQPEYFVHQPQDLQARTGTR